MKSTLREYNSRDSEIWKFLSPTLATHSIRSIKCKKIRRFTEFFDRYFHIPLPIITKHELGLPFPTRNLPIKFGTNPSTIFIVIMVTDRQTCRQTHKPTPVKTCSLAFAGRIKTQLRLLAFPSTCDLIIYLRVWLCVCCDVCIDASVPFVIFVNCCLCGEYICLTRSSRSIVLTETVACGHAVRRSEDRTVERCSSWADQQPPTTSESRSSGWSSCGALVPRC